MHVTHRSKVLFALLVTVLAVEVSLAADSVKKDAVAKAPDFDHEIVPLLKKRCASCHTGPKRRGGLSMNTRAGFLAGGETGPAIRIGKSGKSELIRRVLSDDRKRKMPPKGDRLTPKQVDLLVRWIESGAEWTDGFSFDKKHRRAALAPRRPDLPAGSEDANPIDRLLGTYFSSKKLEPGLLVSDRLFARRVYLDLLGVLPSPDDLAAFEKDKSPDKRTSLVDRLLANSDAYADHWLTFWNDALRNAYRGTGFIDGGRKQITGWLYRSLWENKPYDVFVRELIDPVGGSEGFIKGIKWRGVVNESQRREIQAAQNVAQVFLGTNLKCASCHDSFVNHWKLTDAYAFSSVFADKPLELHRCDKPTGKTSEVRFLYPELGTIDASKPRVERQKQLAALITKPENGRLARTIVNRLWARLLGRGLVEPLDDMDAEPWSQDLLDWLAVDLVDHRYDLKHTLRRITTSRAYSLASVPGAEDEEASDFVFHGPLIKRLSAEQFVDAAFQLTGVEMSISGKMRKRDGRGQGGQWNDTAGIRGSKVEKSDGAPEPTKIPDRRAAKWIWSSENWRETPGNAVTHFRKILDIEKDTKRVRLFVTCDDEYELWIDGKSISKDAVWREVRSVQIPGGLSKGFHWVEVRAKNHTNSPNPAGFIALLAGFDEDGNVAWTAGTDASWRSIEKPEKVGAGKFELGETNSRPVHVIGPVETGPWNLGDRFAKGSGGNASPKLPPRASLQILDPLLSALGRSNREQVVTRRESVATLLQALELTNGTTLDGILKQGASTWLEADRSSAQLIDALWARGLGRAPTKDEQSTLVALVGSPPTAEGVQDALWLALMLPEFQLVR